MNTPKHVFIAGGTGFIGYFVSLALIEKGISVSAIALPNELKEDSPLPKEIHLEYGDLFSMDDQSLWTLFANKEIDTLVYALGPDDRYVPKGDAKEFFRSKLVTFPDRLLRIAKEAKIKKAIVLNSYFSYFDKRVYGKLSNKHPYIWARRRQEEVLSKHGNTSDFEVLFLELPYIFGVMPGRVPLWREFFLDHFDKMKAVFFPWGGGTSAIDVHNVARAIVAAAYYGENLDCIPLGDEYISFKEMLKLMLYAKGSKKRIIQVPPIFAAIGARQIDKFYELQGKQSGLNHFWLMLQIQNKKFRLEDKAYQTKLHFQELGYVENYDVRESIVTTIKACYEKEGD